MPIYEYRCRECGQLAQIYRRYSDPVSPNCPSCGSSNLVRLISNVHIVRSEMDRTRDLTWVDRDLAQRIRRQAKVDLSPSLTETVERMSST
jgi:putative FmdB family regulatory protein